MPFTLAHPLMVVPLFRNFGAVGVPAALVIGSISPDLAYFIPIPVDRAKNHSLLGLFYFCLPLGLAVYAAFFKVIAPALMVLAPPGLSSRLPRHWGVGIMPDQPLSSISTATIVGATTHILWDSFTHPHGLPSQIFPFLGARVADVGGYTVYVYKLLQHASSIGGMAILSLIGFAWFKRTPRMQADFTYPLRTRIALISLAILPGIVYGVVSGVAGAIGTVESGPLVLLQVFLGQAVFSGGPVLFASILTVAVGIRLARRPSTNAT